MRAAKATRTVCHTHTHRERERERENYTHTHIHTQTGNRWPQGVVEREREGEIEADWVHMPGRKRTQKSRMQHLLQVAHWRAAPQFFFACPLHALPLPFSTLRSLFSVLRLGSKFQETIFRNDLTFAFMWKLLQRDVMRTPKGYAMPARLRSNQEGVSTASGIHAGWQKGAVLVLTPHTALTRS